MAEAATQGRWAVRREVGPDARQHSRLIGANADKNGEPRPGPILNGGIWLAETKGPDCILNAAFLTAFDPPTALALLDERDALEARAQAAEAQVREMREIVAAFVAAEHEAPEFGLADCIDNTGEHYQSADFAALIIRASLALSVTPAAEADGWLPIESAPKDGAWVLAVKSGTHPDGYPYVPAVARFDGQEWLEPDQKPDGSAPWEPTHWRPLLAPPAAEKPQQEGE